LKSELSATSSFTPKAHTGLPGNGQAFFLGDYPFEAETPPFNAKALAAMQETRDIMSGKKQTKWYHSIEESMQELGI
jgi:hypothetical protein